MKRRAFIASLGRGSLPFVVCPQPGPGCRPSHFWGRHGSPAFLKRLREFGWIEGHTVAIEFRWADAHTERYAEVAAE
jgi:hypothetical protein